VTRNIYVDDGQHDRPAIIANRMNYGFVHANDVQSSAQWPMPIALWFGPYT